MERRIAQKHVQTAAATTATGRGEAVGDVDDGDDELRACLDEGAVDSSHDAPGPPPLCGSDPTATGLQALAAPSAVH